MFRSLPEYGLFCGTYWCNACRVHCYCVGVVCSLKKMENEKERKENPEVPRDSRDGVSVSGQFVWGICYSLISYL